MVNLAALKQYAQKTDLTTLPASVLFSHTPTSLTIFDAFPKSMFHFLVLPRILPAPAGPEGVVDVETLPEPLKASQLSDLRTLLKHDKLRARDLLLGLREDAMKVKDSIEQEMVRHYGFKWPVWIGFHSVPSMEHLHLHVMSADLISSKLKHKKHYNSFHPKLGFFLHLDDVLSWFDASEPFFQKKSALDEKEYEPLLKEDLDCFVCEISFKNIPKLKEHLQEEWDKKAKKAKRTSSTDKPEKTKRKREGGETSQEERDDLSSSRPHAKRKEGGRAE